MCKSNYRITPTCTPLLQFYNLENSIASVGLPMAGNNYSPVFNIKGFLVLNSLNKLQSFSQITLRDKNKPEINQKGTK